MPQSKTAPATLCYIFIATPRGIFAAKVARPKPAGIAGYWAAFSITPWRSPGVIIPISRRACAQVAARKEASDRFRSQVGDVMKEKGDQFDTMFEAEEKIRLGEAGWKERYYQVRQRISRHLANGGH